MRLHEHEADPPRDDGLLEELEEPLHDAQFQILINYLKTNNYKVYNKDRIIDTADDLTIAKVDAIYDFGTSTPENQKILAQFTALKLNLAISQLDGTSGLVQFHEDICLGGTLNVVGHLRCDGALRDGHADHRAGRQLHREQVDRQPDHEPQQLDVEPDERSEDHAPGGARRDQQRSDRDELRLLI